MLQRIRVALLSVVLAVATISCRSQAEEWVTIAPREYAGAVNNPLKGFRRYHGDGYGLLHRQYVPWNAIETCADDGRGSGSSRTPTRSRSMRARGSVS